MNIMIADDEHIIRSGITAMVNNIGNGFTVTSFACDGEEALEVAKKDRPDIIIADISMPKKNGLEFIAALKQIPDYSPEVIVLTGFRDFDFIQKSMQMGVVAFLLKPVKNNTLSDALIKCKESIIQKNKVKNILSNYDTDFPALKNSFLQNLLTGTSVSEDELSSQFVRFDITPLRLFSIVCIKSNALNHNLLINECPQTNIFNFYFCNINTSETCILVFADTPDNPALYQILKIISQNILKNTGTELTIGISRFYSGADYYSTAYYEALETASSQNSLSEIKFYNSDIGSNGMKKEIRDALNIIARDYSKAISIEYVAEELQISPSHLMHLFKQETGKTFNIYLTEYRMNIAIEMIKSKKYKIYEIADKLGYKSSKHFSRLFKTVTGHSPRDYTQEEI